MSARIVKTSGRRFSRVVETSYDDFTEVLARWAAHIPFEKRIEMHVESARASLRAKGLPDNGRKLDQLLEDQFGVPRDSFEHLAAQFIVAVEDMRSPIRDIAILGAFNAGRLDLLTKVYSDETAKARRRGEKSKRRSWADDFAQHLAHGATSAADARRMAPDSLSPLRLGEDYTIYMDGDDICCADAVNDDAEPKKLAWSTFEKRYLGPALRGQKRR